MKLLNIIKITENLIQPLELCFGYNQTSNFQKELAFQDVKSTVITLTIVIEATINL